jgi:MraZ protein
MIHFLGEYEVTLDAKGRFLLPAKLLSQLPEGAATNFVMNRGFDDCLHLYPMQNWMVVSSEIDSANRLLLPANLKDYAGLTKDVVLSCTKKRIEIWDKSKYHQFFDALTPVAYSALYNKVMTKKNS